MAGRKYQFFLNSAQAELRYEDRPYCEFALKKKLTLLSPSYQFEVSVNRVNLPFSFYQFNESNSSVPITAVVGVNTFSGVFVLPYGNYTLSSMMSALNQLLPGYLTILTGAAQTYAMDYQYNQNTGIARYRYTAGTLASITFGQCDVSNALGFRVPWTLPLVGLLGPFTSGVYTVNMNPIMNVYVTSSIFSDDSSFEAIKGTIDFSSVLAVVPVVHSPWYYQPTDFNVPVKVRISNDTLSNLDFDLVDSKGNEIKLDQPWSLQLTIEEIFIGQTDLTTKPSVEISTDEKNQPVDIFEGLRNQILNEGENVQKRQRQS